MGDKTSIQWTDATWNPVVGCERVSPGCDHCYAIRDTPRLSRLPAYQGLVENGDWTGVVRCLPERLDQPLRWRRSRRIFVNSMSDLFHPDVPSEFIAEVYAVMALAEHHVFQVLTKRPARMAKLLANDAFEDEIDSARLRRQPLSCWLCDWPRPNIWEGTSIEDDTCAWRADRLRAVPAAVRFLSLEPLLGPVPSLDLEGIDWVIVGGESGPGARPLDISWVREIRDRCAEVGVAFFCKQLGSWWARGHGGNRHGADWDFWPVDLRIRQWPTTEMPA